MSAHGHHDADGKDHLVHAVTLIVVDAPLHGDVVKTSSGLYEGQIIWVKNPTFKDGSPKRDIKNPDPAKRNTPGDKIKLLFHFRYDAKENRWVDGEIYDPVHGKFYKSRMWFEKENVLRVRGYIGVPALGRTMTWKKIG